MNHTQLAVIDGQELEVIQRTGKLLAASGYFDGKGESAQAVAMMAAKIMAGREMGFGPFASVNGIHIISGKPSIGANLMAAAVKGSSRYDYRVREMSNDRCTIEFFEREGDKKVSIGISDFTRADAVAAGTQNMTKFGRNMMFARALSNGVRWFCPDVFAGNAVYVPEELGADVDSDGNVIEGSYSIPGVKPTTVDVKTGEVLPPANYFVNAPDTENPENIERVVDVNPSSDAPPTITLASAEQLDRLEKAFKDLYADKWDKNTAKWAEWATTGVTSDITQLSGAEVDAVMEKLHERIAKKVEKAKQAKVAQPQAEAVTA